MKMNVDLTLNHDFDSRSIASSKGSSFRNMFPYNATQQGYSFHSMFCEVYETVELGENGEWVNHHNPNALKNHCDFVNGITLVATGSKNIRKHKLHARSLARNEICDDCGKPLSIPWRICRCYNISTRRESLLSLYR